MRKLKRLLSRIRVKFVRSSRRTKTVVITMIAVCMVSLLTLNLTINAIENKKEADRKEAARLEYENSQLEDKIENQGTVEGAMDAAKDEGYLEGNTSVIQPKPGQ